MTIYHISKKCKKITLKFKKYTKNSKYSKNNYVKLGMVVLYTSSKNSSYSTRKIVSRKIKKLFIIIILYRYSSPSFNI